MPVIYLIVSGLIIGKLFNLYCFPVVLLIWHAIVQKMFCLKEKSYSFFLSYRILLTFKIFEILYKAG